jgi:amidase
VHRETPTLDDVKTLAALDSIQLEAGEAEQLLPVVAGLVSTVDRTDGLDLAELGLPSSNRETRSYQPSRDEDPFNVFISKCRVEGAAEGPLVGYTVGLKDNISLVGVPTTNGSRITPYMPSLDAVVVERILAAGGTIVGKLNMDDFGTTGTGETSAFGPPRNPVNPSHSAGGSSGGSGAAVRAGEVDLALGVDQGGSGRIPAAFCGVVAVKATHGLVPSFGITHIDHTLDCITPIARTVGDAARFLEVIAGRDWRDPQWVRGEIRTGSYAAAVTGVDGLSVAVIEEAWSEAICSPAVLDGARRAARVLEEGGATVTRISLPLWEYALAIFQPYIACLVANMFRSEGIGYGHLGAVDADVVEGLANAGGVESSKLAKQLKCWVIADRYLHDRYANAPYARLQNLRIVFREQVSRALQDYDLLLTPTLPLTAPRLLEGNPSFSEISGRTSGSLVYNTAPLNLSGHPALSIPSGADDAGLPTAVQLVAAHFDEATAFRAAFELEKALGPFVVT